jgi:hypothetical protein
MRFLKMVGKNAPFFRLAGFDAKKTKRDFISGRKALSSPACIFC